MDISFRAATPGDRDFYFYIRKTTIKPYVSQYIPWDDDREYQNIPSKIDPAHDKVIMTMGKEIGLIGTFEDEAVLYLNLLNIVPDYQNRGLGTWLLSAVKDESRAKQKNIMLNTYQNNTRAIQFYLRNEFEILRLDQQPNKYPKVYMLCRRQNDDLQ
jgi:ribosomal protein S18 acetylase RimI-like enzyme